MTTEQKIEKLAREVRIHRIISLTLLLFVVAIFIIAATHEGSNSFDTLTVNQLTVREAIKFQDANQKSWGCIQNINSAGSPYTIVFFNNIGPNKKSFNMILSEDDGSLKLSTDFYRKNSFNISVGDIDAIAQIKSEEQSIDLDARGEIHKGDKIRLMVPGESSIQIYSAKQLEPDKIEKLMKQYPEYLDSANTFAWSPKIAELENKKIYLTLTDYSGLKDIESGGAIFLYNKEAKRVLDIYPDIYGNGRIGIWNKRGTGREITSE